jgi:hypothetical protein
VTINAPNATSARADLTRTVGSGAFDPNTIAGLIGWWKADDAASITASGGNVSQWNNKKTSATVHLVQATGANQPNTGTRTQNGLNVIDFNGTSDAMRAPWGSTLAQPFTVFVVAASDSVAAQRGMCDASGGAASDSLLMYHPPGSTWAIYAGASVSSGVTANTAAHVHTGLFNAASSQMWTDATAGSAANAGLRDMATLAVGTEEPGTNLWDGWIAEVIVYNAALNSTDRGTVQAALKTKWATP